MAYQAYNISVRVKTNVASEQLLVPKKKKVVLREDKSRLVGIGSACFPCEGNLHYDKNALLK